MELEHVIKISDLHFGYLETSLSAYQSPACYALSYHQLRAMRYSVLSLRYTDTYTIAKRSIHCTACYALISHYRYSLFCSSACYALGSYQSTRRYAPYSSLPATLLSVQCALLFLPSTRSVGSVGSVPYR